MTHDQNTWFKVVVIQKYISQLEEENTGLKLTLENLQSQHDLEIDKLYQSYKVAITDINEQLQVSAKSFLSARETIAEMDISLSEQKALTEQVTQLYEAAEREKEHIATQLQILEKQVQSATAVQMSTNIAESHDSVANQLNGDYAAERLELSRLLQERDAEVVDLQQTLMLYTGKIGEIEGELQEEKQLATQLREQLAKLQNSELQSNGPEDSELLAELEKVSGQNDRLKQEIQRLLEDKSQLNLSSQTVKINELVASLIEANRKLEVTTEANLSLTDELARLRYDLSGGRTNPYYMTKIKDNLRKAGSAISRLQEELSGSAEPTKRDQAISGIIDCLQSGLMNSNPEEFFASKKDELNEHLFALRGLTSVFNTAVNAILTVLAVFSIVGIPGLLLTGTLQSNKAKNGSEFAFCMFGAKQKAERDIHEVMQSMSLGA